MLCWLTNIKRKCLPSLLCKWERAVHIDFCVLLEQKERKISDGAAAALLAVVAAWLTVAVLYFCGF